MNTIALDIFQAALQAANPYNAVRRHIDRIASLYHDGAFNRLSVLSIGKAGFPMMQAAADGLGTRISDGIVLTKYGHAEKGVLPGQVLIFEAGHPLPDENGLVATRRILDVLDTVDDRTLVLCLLSGGASALFVAPYESITLEEKQQVTRQLLKAGADIFELNTVRKHISRVKGGRFAEHACPARVISLILSDVIGDRLDVIASGPTAPDASTYGDAFAVISKYGLEDRVPKTVLGVLNQGLTGIIPETPKQDDSLFAQVENIIVGSNRMATEAAQNRAQELGFETILLGCELQGEASSMGRWLAQQALDARKKIVGTKKKICLLGGGETTVKVRGNGLGGRNTEMALVVAKEIAGAKGITFLSAGTDGTDGPTDAAGAIVTGDTIEEARMTGLDPDAYLNNNDSYNFFKPINGLVFTGPTGTNVMDIQVLLIEQKAE